MGARHHEFRRYPEIWSPLQRTSSKEPRDTNQRDGLSGGLQRPLVVTPLSYTLYCHKVLCECNTGKRGYIDFDN